MRTASYGRHKTVFCGQRVYQQTCALPTHTLHSVIIRLAVLRGSATEGTWQKSCGCCYVFDDPLQQVLMVVLPIALFLDLVIIEIFDNALNLVL